VGETKNFSEIDMFTRKFVAIISLWQICTVYTKMKHLNHVTGNYWKFIISFAIGIISTMENANYLSCGIVLCHWRFKQGMRITESE
jgi:uncharacterized membrane protein